jgi:hypothetical protein
MYVGSSSSCGFPVALVPPHSLMFVGTSLSAGLHFPVALDHTSPSSVPLTVGPLSLTLPRPLVIYSSVDSFESLEQSLWDMEPTCPVVRSFARSSARSFVRSFVRPAVPIRDWQDCSGLKVRRHKTLAGKPENPRWPLA